jgi:hypothetical protein
VEDDDPRFEPPLKPLEGDALEPSRLDPVEPEVNEPREAAAATSGLPLESEAAMVTLPGLVEVPPITSAFCTIEFAVKLAPALTTVSPVPVIAPTC